VQQIGAVQGETEADSEQTRSDQRHPRSEVSVMSVNVLHIQRSQFLRHCRAHQRVTQRANSQTRRTSAVEQQGPQNSPQVAPVRSEPSRGPHERIIRERLKIASLLPVSALGQAEAIRRNPLPAAAHDIYPAAAKLRDLIHYVRLHRRRELVGNVGNGSHTEHSSEPQSIPAAVNRSPITNWYAMSTKKALNR